MDIGTAWMLAHTTVSQAATEASNAITGADIKACAKAIGAALAIGIGVFAPGFSEGIAASKAVEGVARNPGAEGQIRIMMLIGQAVTESNSIYALLISLLILFLIR